jgi:hypothetical protein
MSSNHVSAVTGETKSLHARGLIFWRGDAACWLSWRIEVTRIVAALRLELKGIALVYNDGAVIKPVLNPHSRKRELR